MAHVAVLTSGSHTVLFQKIEKLASLEDFWSRSATSPDSLPLGLHETSDLQVSLSQFHVSQEGFVPLRRIRW